MKRKVTETFQITGRGLAVILDGDAKTNHKLVHDTRFVMVNGKKQKFYTESACGSTGVITFSIVLPTLTKEEVPIGTVIEIPETGRDFMDLLDNYLELLDEQKTHECEAYHCGYQVDCCVHEAPEVRRKLIEMVDDFSRSS